MFSPGGLPLGLISATARFQEATYWLSPELWFGQSGIKGFGRRIAIVLLLLTCTLIALISGPSAALLMMPQDFSTWPGGAAKFPLIGSRDTLWPSELLSAWSVCNNSSILDETQAKTKLETDSCSTSTGLLIAQTLQGSKLDNQYYRVEITDGLVRREVSVILPALSVDNESWAITVHLASCVYSQLLSWTWHYEAIESAPGTTGLGSFSKYRYRVKDRTVASIRSRVPITRVSCYVDDSLTSFNEISAPVVSFQSIQIEVEIVKEAHLSYKASLPQSAPYRAALGAARPHCSVERDTN